MNLEAHLHELSEKHRAMEAEIETEMMSPSSDSLLITELKRRKLRLKDEIVRLQAKEAA
ncbi:MAG: DUF465 domain-containing protein [Alphaproteobacteria bacterium]|nr:DUF465 domain-containing protein [Alphaproteobacteria bacterium]